MSTAMHLVSIIYLFISASGFGLALIYGRSADEQGLQMLLPARGSFG